MKYKNFSEIFDKLKQRVAENELTIKEISINTGISENLIEIFFDSNNNVIHDLSRLFQFLNLKPSLRDYPFSVYQLSTDGTVIKISRKIHPKCKMYYQKATGQFYHFEVLNRRTNKMTKAEQELYKSEMKNFLLKKL